MQYIIQISAMKTTSGGTFNQYVILRSTVSAIAHQVTGIVWDGSAMTVNGKPVCAVDLRTALKSFCHWLIKHE